jgi:hypothetical protein
MVTRRLVRIVLGAGLFAGVVVMLLKIAEWRDVAETPDRDPWAPAPPLDAETGPVPAAAWVEPHGEHCPPGYDIKAKVKSGIYHLPGMTAYERTKPDRCYADESAAEADGLRKAKR